MTTLRQQLQLFCRLLAAVWVFSVAVGVVQGCLLPSLKGEAQHAMMLAGAGAQHHAAVADPGSGLHEEALTPCSKHCDDSAAAVLKSIQPDIGKLTVFALISYLLIHLAALLRPAPSQPAWLFSPAIVRDPPTTIRYHRFNN